MPTLTAQPPMPSQAEELAIWISTLEDILIQTAHPQENTVQTLRRKWMLSCRQLLWFVTLKTLLSKLSFLRMPYQSFKFKPLKMGNAQPFWSPAKCMQDQESNPQWIPAHCGIHGNKRANELAKLGSWKPQSENAVTYSKKKKRSLIRALHRQPKERDDYHLLSRDQQVILMRLRTGHNRLKKHLNRLKISASPVCPCGQED